VPKLTPRKRPRPARLGNAVVALVALVKRLDPAGRAALAAAIADLGADQAKGRAVARRQKRAADGPVGPFPPDPRLAGANPMGLVRAAMAAVPGGTTRQLRAYIHHAAGADVPVGAVATYRSQLQASSGCGLVADARLAGRLLYLVERLGAGPLARLAELADY
jgi:hypothetical protein